MTFDSGGLIAFEGRDRRVNALVQIAKDSGRTIVIPAGVLAQVWRGKGPRQARLAGLLSSPFVSVHELTRQRARAIGELCARSGGDDVVDASVVLSSWTNGRLVITSDPDDIRRFDGMLELVCV